MQKNEDPNQTALSELAPHRLVSTVRPNAQWNCSKMFWPTTGTHDRKNVVSNDSSGNGNFKNYMASWASWLLPCCLSQVNKK